jgi:hypothetical protein
LAYFSFSGVTLTNQLVTPAPEPASFGLLALGLAAAAGARRRKA